MDLTQNELKKYLTFAEKTALAAGKILLRYSKKIDDLKITDKEAQGVASEADLASEKFIIAKISRVFPDHKVLAEESAYYDNEEGGDNRFKKGFAWIVDPLDGTHNYLTGFDYYSVCIALTFNGKPVVGVVYRPTMDQCFSAIVGAGAYTKTLAKSSRSKKMTVSDRVKRLKDAIVATGFASEKDKSLGKEFSQFQTIMASTRAVRRVGSASIDICYVAKGIFSGFWEVGLAPWDVAAAGLICQEAGVKVCDFAGKPFDPFDREIVVGRTAINAQLRKLLSDG